MWSSMIFEIGLSSLPLQGTLMLPFLGEGFFVTIYLDILPRASNSLQYREGHEVFSVVTGGRSLSFSRLISGGSRSSPDLSGENAEGAKNPLLISRRKDQAGSLGTEEKTS
jgi:hypothetical protein